MTVPELATQYRSNVITRRWLATIVDLIVLFFAVALIAAPIPRESDGISMLLIFGVPFVYYVVGEVLWGRSVGKLVTGLVVVDQNGKHPSLTAAIVRTVTRFVEVNPFLLGGLPAGIVADRSQYRQRIGDMLAKTYVVFVRDLREIDGLPQASVA